MNSRLQREIKKRGPFQSLEQEVVLNLVRTADALGRQIELLFKPHDLSPTQYNVLRILRGAGGEGLPCGEIAARMITRDPDMTRLLDRLEARGLITRARATDDRRVVNSRITPKGLAELAELDEPVRLAHERQLAHVEQGKLKTLLKLLEEIRANMNMDNQ
jgi:DNA-binding MarR family transcriptional regulator